MGKKINPRCLSLVYILFYVLQGLLDKTFWEKLVSQDTLPLQRHLSDGLAFLPHSNRLSDQKVLPIYTRVAFAHIPLKFDHFYTSFFIFQILLNRVTYIDFG